MATGSTNGKAQETFSNTAKANTESLKTRSASIPLPHYSVEGTDKRTITINSKISDATSEKWPEVGQTTDSKGGAVTVSDHPQESKLYAQWCLKLGELLKPKLNLPDTDADGNQLVYTIDGLPTGYQLFSIHKPPRRPDYYLYGSVFARYRTCNEFMPHLLWLLTNGPGKLVTCDCRYCKKTGQSEVNQNLGLESSRPEYLSSKRSIEINNTPPLRSKRKKIVDHSHNEDISYTGAYAVPDRDRDLREAVKFRYGEVVWFKLRKPLLSTTQDCKLNITHWPSIITDREVKNITTVTGKVLENNVMEMISTPGFAYSIRLFGIRGGHGNDAAGLTLASCQNPGSGNTFAGVGEEELIPWKAYQINMDLFQPSRLLNPTSLAVLFTDEAITELYEDNGMEVRQTSSGSLHKAVTKFSKGDLQNMNKMRAQPAIEFLTTSEQATTVLGYALQLVSATTAAFGFANHYPIKIEHLNALSPFTPAQRAALIRQATESHYQCLWFGAERIWAGEVVRIIADQYCFGETQAPLRGRVTNADGVTQYEFDKIMLFCKIRAFYKTNNIEKTASIAMLTGTIYELVREEDVPEADRNGPRVDGSSVEGTFMPDSPAAGWVFYRHSGIGMKNEATGDHHLSVGHLAGRFYPPAEKHTKEFVDSIHRRYEEIIEKEGQEEASLVEDDMKMAALEGLLPGHSLYNNCFEYYPDRKTLLYKTTGEATVDTLTYFNSLVHPEKEENGGQNGERD